MSSGRSSAYQQPPTYSSHHHVTSRQSKPEMTSRDVYRAESRGVVPRPPSVSNAWICDKERVRLMSNPAAIGQVSPVGTIHQRPCTARSPRLATAAAASSWPRELSDNRAPRDRAGLRPARSTLFSHAPHHATQFHEASNSAPADCTADPRRPRAAAVLPCGPGVRATRVPMRTEYHLTSTTRRSAVTSSSSTEGQRSRSHQGASLWVGVAQAVDLEPVSATALTATVDRNNRKFYTHR